jgi:hypothetical protein
MKIFEKFRKKPTIMATSKNNFNALRQTPDLEERRENRLFTQASLGRFQSSAGRYGIF